MKIFSAAQIKNWDDFTINNEPISSIDLMERAATSCFNWLLKSEFLDRHFLILCGKGNNGGDGLAIARLLISDNINVKIYIAETERPGSTDFQINLERLKACKADITYIKTPESLPLFNTYDIIIDALFGSGLNKPVNGLYASIINLVNNSKNSVIAIDLPTGLFADKSSAGNTIIKATHTLSFQNYKLAFLLPENDFFCGQVHLLDIGLHPAFEKSETAAFEMIDKVMIDSIYKPRSTFAHKGNFGHAALFCGSLGMMGAAVLAAKACLRAGAGKLTAYIPTCGYNIIQSSVPEAMAVQTGKDLLADAGDIGNYSAVGIGPGLGIYPGHKTLLKDIFRGTKKPIVIDADALNIISQNKDLLAFVPPDSIITPHPKEFEHLFGKCTNDFERLELAMQKATELNIQIVLKGHHSIIATPDGKVFFNDTGNPGMATAGSGDVLTGILTGLLAQGYSPPDSCLLGVYLHGLAGDIAAARFSEESMIAGDIITCIGEGYKAIGLSQ